MKKGRDKIEPSEAIAKYRNSTNENLLLVFDASWASTSSMTDIIVNKIERTVSNLQTVIIDIEKHKDLSLKYRVKEVPTCILLSDAEMKFRHEGMFSKKMIVELLENSKSN